MTAPRADLHLHTRYSDGSYEPAELVALAHDLRFQAIAVTDHDSMAALDEAVAAGRCLDVRVIPGVELSTVYGEQETHLVGLFVDYKNPELIKLTERAAGERQKRVFRMSELLAELGIDIDAAALLEEFAGGAVGRVHMAEALVKQGITSSISESFGRFLAADRPAYVEKWNPTPEECVRVIRASGGVAVLAHPGDVIDEQKAEVFAEMGCAALEAYYPTYSRTVTDTYIRLAERLGIGVSGGSDCHGNRKARRLIGSVSVPLEVVDDLESRRG